ncbi:MAG: hypothetical protein LBK18_09825 [Prevotellaceae bacterium]|jgi:hypothetical protein|nr:hypothetical protein [Prevotellaceae bacterium]
MMKQFFAILLFLAVLADTLSAAATVRYVKADGSGSGGSWESASGDLQAMVNASGAGDEVWVAAGAYKPNRPADNTGSIKPDSRDNAFVMKAGVKLYGGFPASAANGTSMASRGWRQHLTVLSGEIGTAAKTDNAYHVVVAAGSMVSGTDTACLDGFIVTGGYADGSSTISVNGQSVNGSYGGGIYSTGTAMRFANDSVVGCYSGSGSSIISGYGGGIYAITDMSTYANVAVSGNTSGGYGGGVYVSSGSPAFANVRISRNTSGGHGGGVYVLNGAPAFTNMLVSGNISGTYSGGVHVGNGTPAFTNMLVSGNTSGLLGGGVCVSSGSPTFTNVRISGNTAGTHGGGVYVGNSTPVFTNTLISGNISSGHGGGVCVADGTPVFIGATIAGNYARASGGGVYSSTGGTINLSNSIVGGNNASGKYIDADSNTPGSDNNIAGSGGYIARYSLLHGSSVTGVGVITGVAPLFVSPDTAKATVPSAGGDYRLQRGSPAVDAGRSDLNSAVTDLGGNPRAQGCAVDMGAYESPYRNSLSNADGVVYVSAGGRGRKDGSSWENAYPDLAYPLYAAQSQAGCGDNIKEIWVSEGTYRPAYAPDSGADKRDVTFAMQPGVKLYGGFPAGGGGDMSRRDWRRHPTVLSGDLGGDDIPGRPSENTPNKTDNAYHVVVAAGRMVSGADTACLDGFVVTGGYANGSHTIAVNGQQVYRSFGGGIYSVGTSMRFANDSVVGSYCSSKNSNSSGYRYYGGGGGICSDTDTSTYANIAVYRNTSDYLYYGGGLYVGFGSPTFTNVRISGNTAISNGGGLYVYYGSPAFTNVHISGNTAAGVGGGMYIYYTSPSFTNVSISGNTAVGVGGGVYIYYASPSFTNVRISGNTASRGGGMFFGYYGNPSFTNVLFNGNTSYGDGGGVYVDSTSAGHHAFTGVTVSGNTAGGNGGGLYVANYDNTTFTNALVSGNTSGSNGGGFYVASGSSAFTGATIAGNYAKGDGGGIYRRDGTVTLNNSIVGNNNTSGSAKNISGSGYYTARYSLLQGSGAAGASVITGDPLFVAPGMAQEGAPAAGGDYRLQLLSPAVDAGSNALDSSATDLDGNPRARGCAVDMGAYESAYWDSLGSAEGVVYVSVGGRGRKDGSSWDNAYPDLAYPLYVAQQPSRCGKGGNIKEIWVSEGRYTPAYAPASASIGDRRDATFAMLPGVKLYGGFPAGGGDMSRRDWRRHPTVLSGDLNGDDTPNSLSANKADNAYHVVMSAGRMASGADTACLDGFVVTGGYADGSDGITVNGQRIDRNYGGGIYATTATSTYANVAVNGNASAIRGGGVYLAAGNAAFTNALIGGNSTGTFGGGVYVGGGYPAFTNATVAGNYAGIDGGGVYRGGGAVTLLNSIVGGNNAPGGSNNNNIYGSSRYYNVRYSLVHGGGVSGAGVITGDPLFVAPDTAKELAPSGGGDYRLRLLSPAVDAGSNSLNGASKDLAGNPRAGAGQVDMGAYEHQAVELRIAGAALARKIYDGTDTAAVDSVTLGCSDEAVAGHLTLGVEYTAVGKIVSPSPDKSSVEAGTGKTAVVMVRILPAHLPPARYTFPDTTFTLHGVEVERRPITVAAAPQAKTYGEVNPQLTWHLTSGSLVGGDTLAGSLRHNGAAAGRYAIIQNTPLTNPNYLVSYVEDSIAIAPALLTVTPIGGQRKVYGESDPDFAFAVSGWQYGDEADSAGIITGALRRAAGDTAGVYSITQGSLSAGSSYDVSFTPSVMFEVARLRLTVSGTEVQQVKVHDGSDSVHVIAVGALNGVVGGDDVTLFATARYDSSAVGEGKSIAVSYRLGGLSAGNYAAPNDTTLGDGKIAIARLTVSGTAVESIKSYDGSDSARVTSVGTLSGVAPEDDVVLLATARYNSRSVGEGKTITVTYRLAGEHAGRYIAPERATYSDARIVVKQLTALGTAVQQEKIHDDSDSAHVTSTGSPVGVIGGEDVTLLATAKYSSDSVGGGKAITVSYRLGGADRDSYAAPQDTTLGDGKIGISRLTVSGTAVESIKDYDGSDSVHVTSVGTLSGMAADEDVTLYATAQYNNSSIGYNKPITVRYRLGGADAGKYLAPANGADRNGEIMVKRLGVSDTSVLLTLEKVYDGSDSAHVISAGTLVGVASNEEVTLSAVAQYDNKLAGEYKTVIVIFSISGTHVGNYVAPGVISFVNVMKIKARPLTVSGTLVAKEKAYDDIDSAHVVLAGVLDGVVGGDDVKLSVDARYDNSSVGVDKPIAVTYRLSGADAGSYIVPAGFTLSGGKIAYSQLTVSGTQVVREKLYDGSNSARVISAGTLRGMNPNIDVSLLAAAQYDSPSTGSGKQIAVTYRLVGADKDSYAAPASVTYGDGVIAARPLTVLGTLVAKEKLYDGSDSAHVVLPGVLDGVLIGDDVKLSVTAKYDSSPAGVSKTIAVSYTLIGADAGSYIPPAGVTLSDGKIGGTQLTVSGTAVQQEKVYDGSSRALVTSAGVLSGMSAGEEVTLLAAAEYDSKFVGSGKVVAVAYSLVGAHAGGYVAPASVTYRDGAITARPLTVSGTQVAKEKAYDGSDSARVTSPGALNGVLPGDDVKLSAAAKYDDRSAGSGKAITVAYSLSGYSAGSYAPPADAVISGGKIIGSELNGGTQNSLIQTISLVNGADSVLMRWRCDTVGDTIRYRLPCSSAISLEQLKAKYTLAASSVEMLMEPTDLIPSVRRMFITKLLSGGQTKRYTVIVEKPFSLFDVVNEHVGSLRVVNNNPATNGHGLTFSTCEWRYKRDSGEWLTGEPAQLYYTAGSSVRDKFTYRDSMYVVLRTASGERLETCPDASPAAHGGSGSEAGDSLKNSGGLSVYPNPVAAGGVIRLKQAALIGDGDELYTRLYLLDAQGRPVLTGDASALRSGLTMPEIPGIYHLVLEGKSGRKVVKIAVGQRRN